MALTPNIESSRTYEAKPESSDNNISELNDILKKAAKKLDKKKGDQDESVPEAILVPQIVPLQDRKIQSGNLGLASSVANRAAIMDFQNGLEMKTVATNLVSAATGQSAGAEAALAQDASLVASSHESTKLKKPETSDMTSPLPTITPSILPAEVRQVSLAEKQERAVLNQDIARHQMEMSALQDKNTAASTETKYSFSSWGGNQSVIIAGGLETGYKFRASDNEVKHILDKHLSAHDGSLSLGITSVESATDEQPKQQRQSSNHNRGDDADE